MELETNLCTEAIEMLERYRKVTISRYEKYVIEQRKRENKQLEDLYTSQIKSLRDAGYDYLALDYLNRQGIIEQMERNNY